MYGTSLNIKKDQRHKQGITRVVSITSGKGGVGKTHISVNCGLALARMGRSVAILDADLSLANINVMLGLKPKATLQDVVDGRLTLEDTMLDGPDGIVIIPATSGTPLAAGLTPEQRLLLIDRIEEATACFDYLLVDTQAGIGPDVMYFNSAASEIICVITAEPTSLTDAYALIKVLAQEYGEKEISIVANNVQSESVGKGAYLRLARAVERFLHVKLCYLGAVLTDSAIPTAISEQRALLDLFPSSQASMGFVKVAEKLDLDFYTRRVKGGMQFFFRELMDAAEYGC